MLEALGGDMYLTHGKGKGRLLIKLLVRLNEYVLERTESPYVKYDADDK